MRQAVADPTIPVSTPSPTTSDWVALRYLALYRLFLGVLCVGLEYWRRNSGLIGEYDPSLFARAAIVYLFVAVVFLVSVRQRWPAFSTQLGTQALTDIVALTVLIYASGGVNSGLGILLIATVAGVSVLSYGRIAVLFAALATLAILTVQLIKDVNGYVPAGDYTHAGLLGVTYFTTAILGRFSARRARASQSLAARQAVDLENLAQLNEHIIQRMQSGILVVDGAGRIRMFNESAQRLLGINADDRGGYFARVVPAVAEFHEQWCVHQAVASKVLTIAASSMDVSVAFAALSDQPSGGALIFAEDTAAMNQRAQQLKLASLGRLTASIAHEIRNPLEAISHAGQLLGESTALPVVDQRLVEIIKTNSRRVNDIIESVLQLSRRTPSVPVPVAAGRWLNQFAEDFYTHTTEMLAVEVEPPELELFFDPGQLRQVLWNLVENSIRHGGPKPQVVIQARLSADGVRPILDVIDDGPGLDEATMLHLFEPFFTTRTGGTGLGLYIARELCEANQAVLAPVAIERGACFRVTFADPRRNPTPV